LTKPEVGQPILLWRTIFSFNNVVGFSPRFEGTMRRRKFIALVGGVAAAWPLAARAQQSDPKQRIGVLTNLTENDPEGQARIAAFLQGLQQLGWTDGRNVRIDTRWTAGDVERIRKHAAELVALAPDVIFATGGAVVGPWLQAGADRVRECHRPGRRWFRR
jgi:ABC-type uncharacterized transport system substrate-binding protein